MARVFLDVGAHDGQTLQEVINHPFDRIYAFEPMPAQYTNLRHRFVDERVQILPFGLSDRTCALIVYGTNAEMEASVYPCKADVDTRVETLCEFVAASEFFANHLTLGDDVTAKFNCEGSEVAILDNLTDTGEIWKIDRVVVDFDVRKIPGMESEEARVRERLATIGFDRLAASEEVMVGVTHQERIRNWLAGVDRHDYLATL